MPAKKQVQSKDKVESKQRSSKSAAEEVDLLEQQQPQSDALLQPTRLDPGSLTPRDVMQLQRTIGNQATQRLLQSQEQTPVQRQGPGLQTDPGGESGTVQVREQSGAQELVVQRKGTYPENFVDKSGQEIGEIEYGTGQQITFGTMTSCLGIVARKGDTVTGVHLGMVSGDESKSSEAKYISEFSQSDQQKIIKKIKSIIGNPDKIVYVGYPTTIWSQIPFYGALKAAVPPDKEVDKDGANYVAGVENGLLHIGLDDEEVYTEPPAPRRKFCFITTACVEAKGLPDDCYELTTLRAFRDGYMSALPFGPALIAEYYKIAPQIVARIKEQPEAAEILAGLYSRIAESVDYVQRGENEKAMQVYSAMVLHLKKRYLAHG